MRWTEQSAMPQSRTCAECSASLPEGLPDIFCPACALRRALTGTTPVSSVPKEIKHGGIWPISWFQRLQSWFRGLKTVEPSKTKFPVDRASAADKLPQVRVPMVTPEPGEVI